MPSKVKTYVLDTNILMGSNAYSLYSFDEHNIVIADVTLEELDNNKNREGEVGFNAREAIRILEELRKQGSLLKGVPLPSGGTLRIEQNHIDIPLPESWDPYKADNRILRICMGLQKDGLAPILVTNDINVRLKAESIGIPSEEYRTDRVSEKAEQYVGRREVYADSLVLSDLYNNGEVYFDRVGDEHGESIDPPILNEFFLIRDITDLKHTGLARFDGRKLVTLKYDNSEPYGIIPRNMGHRFAIEALMSPVDEAPLVILKGGAGTGKTFLSIACGMQQVLGKHAKYKKILIVRPNVKFDDDIGYLKGSEEDKIGPLMRPIFDNIENLCNRGHKDTHFEKDGKQYSYSYIDELFDNGIIEMQAMAYMRGRSITDTYIILDEFQNASATQAFGIISRVGEGSKLILAGDIDQIDNPRLDSRSNGLSFASERMKGSPLCWQLAFNNSECVRSPLAIDAITRLSPKGYTK